MYCDSNISSTLQYTEKMNEAFQTFCYGGEENLGDIVRAATFVRWRNQEYDETKVHYFCPSFLPKMKYIVLSATLNAEVYRKYFKKVKYPMDIFLYEEKKVRYTGKLIQYTYHSLGRKDLTKKLQVFDVARELANESIYGFITYQTFPGKDKVTNHKFLQLHFGKGTKDFFSGRISDENILRIEDMGPPPPDRVTAGRANSQGIRCLYT